MCTNAGGGGGGGMLNKDSSTTVLSSHPLTDYIGKGGSLFANEIMNTRDAFEREYGEAAKGIKLHVGTFGDKSALGVYGGDTLYMNERYVTNNNLTEAMRAGAQSGFHPSIGNKSGAAAVAAHEIGHRLGQKAAERAGVSEKEIVARAAKRMGTRTNRMAASISGYARTNYSETIAEASSDVFCNGSKASRASIAIMREVKNALR